LHHRLGASARGDQDSDGQLLQRFAALRDPEAFASLMRRHGQMVLGVCRRVLSDAHDADDAFQATFLVLIRKAGSLGRPELLGNWLYGVAYRTAARLRAQAAARHRRERHAMHELAAPPAEDPAWREVRSVIDEELNRLPERYRRPFVLCHLEGLTNDEAARRLGCPKGTVASRVSRACERLRDRLQRRGVTLTTTALTALVAENATAAVPVALFDTTLTSALLFAAGPTAAAGTLASPAATLAEGVLKNMFLAKLKTTVAVLLLVAAAGSGAGMLAYRPGGQDKKDSRDEPQKIAQQSPAKKDDKPEGPPPANPNDPQPAQAKDANRLKEIIDRMPKPVEFPGFDDPRMTLQDALEFFNDRTGLSFHVDEAAFKEAGYADKSVLAEPIATTPIPKMRDVRLTAALRIVLSRIGTPPGQEATYLIRPDHVEITTRKKARSEAFRDGSRDVPLVDAVFEKRPLGEALTELATSYGLNLVIDMRVEEKTKTAVSATLLNAPVDTAIRVLADMADLQPAFLDNVIYLTTKENAKRLEQESPKRAAPPATEKEGGKEKRLDAAAS
jgi:RNA polymerase sigma factor (sigma-70 family)